MEDVYESSLRLHKENAGKIELGLKVPILSKKDLSLAYTPGVAAPCLAIQSEPQAVYDYTSKGNWIAVVTNGTAILGLGDIGCAAGLPVMEGKAALFKKFAGLDAFPICVNSKDTEEIVRTVKLIATSFGGVNLEDIKAPECFEIERRLIEELDIPVFHDDQHGTAVVVLAALTNALELAQKNMSTAKVVINGSGSAGVAIAKLLIEAGYKNIVMLDKHGVLTGSDANPVHAQMAEITNPEGVRGDLRCALKGADVFIGVSAGGIVKPEMVRAMNEKAIVFAMANPTPEIFPNEAAVAGAFIAATGRSDFPNQVNNVLAFPGIFKGALAVRASLINTQMKLAAANAIADTARPRLSPDYIIPDVFDEQVVMRVSQSVAEAAVMTGVAGIK